MELKQERHSLRLTGKEKKLIRKRAIDKDIKISEYIMDLVEKDINSTKNNLNIEYERVKSSINCISKMVNNFKDNERISLPPLLPTVVNELMQELESLKEALTNRNLIDLEV